VFLRIDFRREPQKRVSVSAKNLAKSYCDFPATCYPEWAGRAARHKMFFDVSHLARPFRRRQI